MTAGNNKLAKTKKSKNDSYKQDSVVLDDDAPDGTAERADTDDEKDEAQADEELLQEALDAFQIDYDYWQPEYQRAENDMDFSLGDQWPQQVKVDRDKEGRPCLTENRIDVSCIQVINDIRQSRPSINVLPNDDKADIETAKVLKGTIRNIEQQSNASNAYDMAAEHAVRGGYGFIRVNTRYADPLSFDQEVTIEAVDNPFSCMIDSNIKRMDGLDACRGWVFVDMPKKQFEQEYPDAQPLSFDPDLEQKHWYSRTGNIVRLAEYYYKVEEEATIYNTAHGTLTEKDIKALGIDPIGLPSRKTKVSKIKWCKFNAQEILEKTEWVGKYIPIVPVFGKVVWTQGRRKSFSLTYQGRDPQMRFNYMISAETEWTALQPKAPWTAYSGQLDKAQYQKYAESNIKNHAVLLSTPTYDQQGNLLPKPSREGPPAGSASLMQQSMQAADGIKATLGIFDASLGAQGNEQSGRAILARQSEGDNATFHFMDNLATSICHVGRILVDLIPKIYSNRTIARILGDDNEPRMVPIGQRVMKQGKNYVADPTGNLVIQPDAGKYDVTVTIGPSYATKRQEMTTNMFELFKLSPQLMQMAGDIFFKNSDWDGAQELAERAKKMLPPQFQDENPDQQALIEADQKIQGLTMQLAQMEQALKQKMDNQQASNEIELRKVELQHSIDEQKIQIDKDKLALEALKAQNEINPQGFRALITSIAQIGDQVNDVSQAVSMILDDMEQGEVSAVPPAVVDNQAAPMQEGNPQ